MASELLGEKIFEDLVIAILRDAAKAFLPGGETTMVLAKHAGLALCRLLSGRNPMEQQAELDGISRVPYSRSWDIAARKVADTDLPEEQQDYLVRYLSAIPMTSRQALRHWKDGGHVTTLVSQLPRTEQEAARFMPVRASQFRPGDRIPNHDLRLDMMLGQGGFAEVWKAHNPVAPHQPPVALKFCLEPALVPSLKREIDLQGALKGQESGKDIVQLLQTAYSADPPFLVYEYIDGGNLNGWLDAFQGGAPKPNDVVAVMKMVARGVALAHDNGIVHRDLKPANLLVTSGGRVLVSDFGIGHLMAEREAGHDARDSQDSPGTPMYSDPMRDRLAPASPQDDVYAMGVVSYQLLMASTLLTMQGAWRRHLELRNAPARLIDVIETCVAPAKQRFTDAGAVLAALEGLKKPAQTQTRRKATQSGNKTKARAAHALDYCHSCGTKARRSDQFCTVCGYRFPAAAS